MNPLETMQIILAVVLVVFIVVLLKVRQKGQGNAAAKKSASKSVQQKASGAKKSQVASPSKKAATTTASPEQQTTHAETDNLNVKAAEAELTSSSLNQPVKVSVQEVNPLTEYKVYREFGYLDKASEALQSYLKSNPNQDSSLYFELAEIYLQAEQ